MRSSGDDTRPTHAVARGGCMTRRDEEEAGEREEAPSTWYRGGRKGGIIQEQGRYSMYDRQWGGKSEA